MVGGRSRIVSVCSSLFFVLVCWAIQQQFLASGEERSDFDQFRSSLGLINLSNLGSAPIDFKGLGNNSIYGELSEVNTSVHGNLLCGNVMPSIRRFGLIDVLGKYFEGDGGPAMVSQKKNCLKNATTQRSLVSESHNLGQANTPESPYSLSYNLGRANAPKSPHSLSYNLGWANAPKSPHSLSYNLGRANAPEPPHSNKKRRAVIIILLPFLLVVISVIVTLCFECYERLHPRIAREMAMPWCNGALPR